MRNKYLLQPGANCWRIECASRVSLLVDGEAYYGALRQSLCNAENTIFILGWDIDSRLELIRDQSDDGLPTQLGPLLHELVKRKPALHVYVLVWDFSMIYMREREWAPPFMTPNWRRHKRVHFCMDNQHPLEGSHHQKIVVVDDDVAFVGGFDLSKSRWDSSEHIPNDKRRIDPDGNAYPPFHDMQMLVEGNTANALGDLARSRWKSATGKTIPSSHNTDPHAWPEQAKAVLRSIDVAITRTIPQYNDTKEVREVEALHLDAIASAKQSIYIENQYFTSKIIADALVRRLEETGGPEIIIVLPRETGGWLEQTTMDVLRARELDKIKAADHENRLRIYYPHNQGLEEKCISVHAKLLIIDDQLLKIGSANLSNRSMGLDSECELVLCANGDMDISEQIKYFNFRLLAEHLDYNISTTQNAFKEHQSLIKVIETLCGKARTLTELDYAVSEELNRQVPDSVILDPERPLDADKVVDAFVGCEEREAAGKRLWLVGLFIISMLVLAAAWRWTSLGEWLDPALLAERVEIYANNVWLSGALIVAIFILGSIIAIPISLMIIAVGLVFGSLWGFVYSLIGACLAALVTYSIGAAIGKDTIRRIAGNRINRLSKKLAKRGIITVVALRILPVAPFTIVNLVAGASHIRMRDFMIGSFIGILPGIFVLTTFVDQLMQAVEKANFEAYLTLAGVVIVLGGGMYWLKRWLAKEDRRDESQTA